MGNSPTVLLRDYGELTTEAEAKEWFEVNPGERQGKVTTFTKKQSSEPKFA
jgi:hypothetical protein